MIDYEKKLKNLPNDIGLIYSATAGVLVNVELGDKYKFSDAQRAAYLDIVAGLFFKEIKINDLASKLKVDLKLNEKTAGELTLDIVGRRLLPADAWFNGAAKKYLGVNETYDKLAVEYLAAVTAEEKAYAAELEEDAPYEMPAAKEEENPLFDPQREKQDTEELFKESLVSVLDFKNQEFLSQFNTVLLKLIVEDNFFKRNLEQFLYKNQEELTTKPFFVNNEKSSGTIENWLKDFISQNGSEIFSNIVLAKYLTSAENTKILDPEERNLVKKLLKLYRNLVFFPDSMKDIPIDDWELFPIDRDVVEKIVHPIKISFEEHAVAKKVLEELESGQTKIMPHEESPEIKSLRALAEKYAVGSLERRAVEAEIKKKI